MKNTDIAINIEKGRIKESIMITAELTGEWADGTKTWTDEEGNYYTWHYKKVEGQRITYFILEGVKSDQDTSWKISRQ